MYIVFEGIIGTGKTTQSKKYCEYLKNKFPNKKVIWTREPGGTEIAEDIRKVVQVNQYNEPMESVCESYLYAASRAQALRAVVKPVLDEDGIVVSDRNFVTSLTNQAFGRGLGIEKVLEINKVAIEGFIPDKVIFLDVPIKDGLKRTFDAKGDKFESLGEDFYEKVYEGHKKVAKLPMFKGKWITIDGLGTADEVFDRIVEALGL